MRAGKSSWTAQRIADISKLWLDGVPATDIGARYGLTRNAVLGKMHRLGIIREDVPPKAASGRVNLRPIRPARLTPPPKFNDGVRKPPKPLPGPLLIEVKCDPVRLADLRGFHCRWVLSGEPQGCDTLHCGAQKARGAYCEAHAEVAFIKPTKTKSEYARSLRRYA